MMNRLSAVWLCAIGALVACGGNSESVNGGGTGGGSTAGSASSGGSSAGQSTSGGSTAANSAGSNTGGANGTGRGGSSSTTGGTFSVGNGGSSTGGSSTGGIQDMSDPGSGTCPAFTPCGGSLVGTWHIDSLCISPPIMQSSTTCPSAQDELSADGTLTFGADGSFDPSKVMLSVAIVYPPSCIADSTACDQLGTELGPCTSTADGGCRCTPKTTTTMASMESYVTSGSTVVLTSTDPNTGVPKTETAYYCVTGNQLRLRGRSSSSTAFVYALTRQ